MRQLFDENLISAYLKDESKKTGQADFVLFPESEEDVIEIMKSYPDEQITIQGSLTGVTAGAVPYGGIIISTERFNRIINIDDENMTATVQPGVILRKLRKELNRHKLVFTPDPTETSASIGGMIACNSSGARSYKYGATRNHIESLRVVLRNGEILEIDRSAKASGFSFSLPTDGALISGTLPQIKRPAVSKNTAGYYIASDMDLIDLFIGSEGTLGIITEAKLRLIDEKNEIWGCFTFFSSENKALKFVHEIRDKMIDNNKPEAIEFFGQDCLDMLKEDQLKGDILSSMPRVAPAFKCAVYTEHAADDLSEEEQTFGLLAEIICASGGSVNDTWVAANNHTLEQFKDFRHAAPACVNKRISEIKKDYPEITKLGTDMSVPDTCLDKVFKMYRQDLKTNGFKASVFGHIGNNHLHINIIPSNSEEYIRGKELYTEWAAKITDMGGSVSAEHGIGKLKTWLLEIMYSRDELEGMQSVRRAFAPKENINNGNVIK